MNGVILYADDDVLNDGTYENKLFQKFNRSLDYSILPITNISFPLFEPYYSIGLLRNQAKMRRCRK